MNFNYSEKELQQLLALVNRWKEQGYVPNIEKDIALDRLRKLYCDMLDFDSLPAAQPSDAAATPIVMAPQTTPMEVSELSRSIDKSQNTCQLGDQIEAISQTVCEIEKENMESDQPRDSCEESEIIEIQPVDDAQSVEEPLQQLENTEPQEEPNIDLSEQIALRNRRFIHDLFCNDESFYLGEMRKIEALASFDDVLIYIGQKYAWTPENKTAEEFVTMISGRFL